MQLRKLLALGAALVAALVTGIVPASAITDGELDGDGHPGVVPSAWDWWITARLGCSGTLLSTDRRPYRWALHQRLSRTALYRHEGFHGVRRAERSTTTYPLAGPTASRLSAGPHIRCSRPRRSTSTTSASQSSKSQASYSADDDYGVLPQANQLDQLKTRRGQQDATFTTAGYGVQKSFPDAAREDGALKVRMVAHPKLNQINVRRFRG